MAALLENRRTLIELTGRAEPVEPAVLPPPRRKRNSFRDGDRLILCKKYPRLQSGSPACGAG